MGVYGRCSVPCATIRGVIAEPVDVEVAISGGIPAFYIVGMGDTAVQESRVRVRDAIKAAGFSVPSARIVVNLAPSGLKKNGTGFDLAIAVAILVITGQIPATVLRDRMFVGELSLEGAVKPVNGMIAYGLSARSANLELVCSAFTDEVFEIDSLSQVGVRRLEDLTEGKFVKLKGRSPRKCDERVDFRDIGGNDYAKRALQIAACGSHGVLMVGPPGSGKTMLAERIPTILPPLQEDEALQSALIHSVAGEDIANILMGRRPFRSPHHSATAAGLIGGGTPTRPGEISLAHNGVLMLDELAEFKPAVLQCMRQPLEDGRVVITRADGNVVFPARFMLIAATNPCPCGYLGDPERSCTCSESQIHSYRNRIGGPLMDRIDIHLDVKRVDAREVMGSGGGTSSTELRNGVVAGREFASWRRLKHPEEASTAGCVSSCMLEESDRLFFENTCKMAKMSGRGIVRTLRIARTIADMEMHERVERSHLCEALNYRVREGGGSC